MSIPQIIVCALLGTSLGFAVLLLSQRIIPYPFVAAVFGANLFLSFLFGLIFLRPKRPHQRH